MNTPKVLLIVAGLLLLEPATFGVTSQSAPNGPRIVKLDPRFDAIVPKDAVLEKVAEGFAWAEGPVWNRAGEYLLFSDVPNNAVIKWKAVEGASVFLKPSGYTGDKLLWLCVCVVNFHHRDTEPRSPGHTAANPSRRSY